MKATLHKLLLTLAIAGSMAWSGPVSFFGQLQTSGNRLVGSKKPTVPVQVRGVSLGWSNSGWNSASFFNAQTVSRMAQDWKAEIIRAPLGYDGYGGYSEEPENNQQRVELAVQAAIDNDIYVIIDWHSHKAHEYAEKTKAIAFLELMAQKYGKNDHVIFEVYNEPLSIDWNTIRSYAQEAITAIRKHSDNLVLVGTPRWCQEIDQAASNPLSQSNVAYVLHFYAQSHTIGEYKGRLETVLNAGLVPFISEYGTTHSDGGDPTKNNYNTHSTTRTDAWHQFLDQHQISSVAWNLNDKYEGSAFFGIEQPNLTHTSNASWINLNNMTPSGQYIYKLLTEYAQDASWHTASCAVTTTPSTSFKGLLWHAKFPRSNTVLNCTEPGEIKPFVSAGSVDTASSRADGFFTTTYSVQSYNGTPSWSGGGVTFNLAQAGARLPVDISDYSGVCLAYSATHSNGYVAIGADKYPNTLTKTLAASSGSPVYISFNDMARSSSATLTQAQILAKAKFIQVRVPDATGSYTLKLKAVALASGQTQCNTLFNDLNTHVMRSIPQQVAVGTGALTLEVDTTGVFNDFGEKDKTLSVTTDAGSAVTASVTTKGVRLAFTGSTILAGASSKTFKVTVKAADAPHADAVTTFNVMVRASNSPPVATTQKLTINYISQGGKLTIKPTGLFTDPENDSMTYRIETSSPKVLIDGMVVQGIKDSSGIIQIQVIATDVCGASTSRTFDITLRAPVVKPDAVLSGFGYAQSHDWKHVLSTARHGMVQVRNLQGQILFSAPAPVSPQQVLQALGDSPAIVQLGRSYWRLHKTQP